MSKKQKKVEAKVTLDESKKQDQISEGIVYAAGKAPKAEKQAKAKDKKKKKDKTERRGGLVKKTKETMSELKKVTWPTFATVVKKTGIVIAFVLIFAVFLFAVNTVLGGLVNLLIGKPFWG